MQPLVEVFIFDYSGDLYGRILTVEFVAWLRGEEKFSSIEALVAQMREDVIDAKRTLSEAAAREGASIFEAQTA